MFEIKNFGDLIKDHLPKDLEFVSYTIKTFTEPGENYASEIYGVHIKCVNKKTYDEETIHAVAKTPPLLEFEKKRTANTFKSEIEFYKTILPLLQEVQVRHGLKPMKCFAKFLGGRLNLNNSVDLDSNGILLVEDIAVKGFKCADKFKGFDLNTTKIILQDLANFHAAGIALKLQCPEVFNSDVKPNINLTKFLEDFNGEKYFIFNMVLNESEEVLNENEEFSKYAPAFVKLISQKMNHIPTEPFGTITHQDLWINNIMLKKEIGKFIENKFIDFQLTRYLSPADDVLLLLLVSVQSDIILNRFDYLIDFYYRYFITYLQQLGVDTKPFSRKAFDAEIQGAGPQQLERAATILFAAFATESQVKQLKEVISENLSSYRIKPNEIHKERLYTIIKLYSEKGWLN